MVTLSKDIKVKFPGADIDALRREKRSDQETLRAADREYTRITDILEKEFLSKKDGPRLLKMKELSTNEKFSKIISSITARYDDVNMGNEIARFFMLAMLNTDADAGKAARFASVLLNLPQAVALSASKLLSDESYVWHNAIFKDMQIFEDPGSLAALSNAGYASSKDPEEIPYWFYRMAMYVPKNSMMHLDTLNALVAAGTEPHKVRATMRSISEIAEDIYYADADPGLMRNVLLTVLSSSPAATDAIAAELSKISKQLFSNETDGYTESYKFNRFADICTSIRGNPQVLAKSEYLHTIDYTSRIELLLGESKRLDSAAKSAA